MALISSTQQRQVYCRYFLAVLVPPSEGLLLLVTDREMTFGHPSVLCGIEKPCGCLAAPIAWEPQYALVRVAQGFPPTSNQEFGGCS